MDIALYYPHTSIHSERIIRDGLLLWEKIEYIAPTRGYRPDYANQPDWGAAMDLIGEPRVPTQEEMRAVHEGVVELLNKPLPADFLFETGRNDYLIFPQKFLFETWQLLDEKALVGRQSSGEFEDYAVSNALGLTLMGLLADVCAGTQRRLITDRPNPKRAVENWLKTEYASLVDTTVAMIDSRKLGLARLIEWRKRRGQQPDTVKLRQNYRDRLDAQFKLLLEEGKTEADRDEIKRKFELEMKSDLQEIAKQLRFDNWQTLLSTEMRVFAGLAVGTIVALPAVAPISPALAVPAVMAAGCAWHRLRKTRRDALLAHPMSYLYAVDS